MYHITSHDLKLALMHYYRFNYGYVCAEECVKADILVDTGKEIIEVEVKIGKGDLIEGEKAKALKHIAYIREQSYRRCYPNKFLFCVPTELVNEAVVWANRLNVNYGVIEFDSKGFQRAIEYNNISWMNNNCYLVIRKSAKKLHENYDERIRFLLARRASSQCVNLMTEKFMHHLRLENNG